MPSSALLPHENAQEQSCHPAHSNGLHTGVSHRPGRVFCDAILLLPPLTHKTPTSLLKAISRLQAILTACPRFSDLLPSCSLQLAL
jgi:hypothetical protein